LVSIDHFFGEISLLD
jgi:predicted outer membrane repeat protein